MVPGLANFSYEERLDRHWRSLPYSVFWLCYHCVLMIWFNGSDLISPKAYSGPYFNLDCNIMMMMTCYRAMLRRARYCIATSVSLSVCPSVTLRYRDHIGWNSSKIISSLVSLGSSLSKDPDTRDLLQGEHPEISAGIGERCWKSDVQHTKVLISLKRCKIGPRLLLRTIVLGLRGILCAIICPLILTLDPCRGPIRDWKKLG